ncbi:carboxylesterase family protein [Streptomyces sp. TRM68416]|uniref:carboxylesterase family protein n=1 Tax=Streptomyces sp. TRM68416 TaxID=2758412 RepID=UPI001661E9D7|nr:carboxylesterase family protein [Streptomyces sp. TRM68416]MBD0843972.1 carboxylesterase family protein [Streptomyces sp. TRM68416]
MNGVGARDRNGGGPGRFTVHKGIPYAASTANANRWRPPQPTEEWSGVRAADTFGAGCPQGSRVGPTMSENCLNLNVWTAAESSRDRRPVFVWIYGGRFIGGSGSNAPFDGPGPARKGLVVVTLNYRTASYGFLSTPEPTEKSGHGSSGNYGLLDQLAALKWVRRNIAAFGGDPDNVTIAGQSTGAASVLGHVSSPRSSPTTTCSPR